MPRHCCSVPLALGPQRLIASAPSHVSFAITVCLHVKFFILCSHTRLNLWGFWICVLFWKVFPNAVQQRFYSVFVLVFLQFYFFKLRFYPLGFIFTCYLSLSTEAAYKILFKMSDRYFDCGQVDYVDQLHNFHYYDIESLQKGCRSQFSAIFLICLPNVLSFIN